MAINVPVSSAIFIAYDVNGLDSEPTPKDYEQLRQQTQDFFVLCLKKAFPEQFAELNLQIGLKEFRTGKPHPEYNVYVEWDIQANFTSSSSSASKDTNKDVPSPDELTDALLESVVRLKYLVNYVRTGKYYAFYDTAGVFAELRTIYIKK
jgi:hypothetical protein